MDFSLDDETRMMKETIHEWAQEKALPRAKEIEANSKFPEDLVMELEQLGFLAPYIPESFACQEYTPVLGHGFKSDGALDEYECWKLLTSKQKGDYPGGGFYSESHYMLVARHMLQFETIIKLWDESIPSTSFYTDIILTPVLLAEQSQRTQDSQPLYSKELEKQSGVKTKQKKKGATGKIKKKDAKKLFLFAYNSKNSKVVHFIKSEMVKRGLRIWIDTEQIKPGDDYIDLIQNAILEAESVVIIIGSYGIGKWQDVEYKSALIQRVKRKAHVVPVLLPGVDKIPDDLLFLQNLDSVSFNKNVREKEALDRLEWGLTGRHPNG